MSRHGDAAFPPPPSIAAALCGAAPRWAQGLAKPVMPDAAAALPCPSAAMEEKRAVLQRLDFNPLKRCMIQFSGGFQPERSDERNLGINQLKFSSFLRFLTVGLPY